MKQLKKLKVFGLMAMLISMVIMASSCSDDDTGGRALSYGKVTGASRMIYLPLLKGSQF